ncbi:VOC family protein [uncultured Amnibacterium sp.]|uniref:VOC family protein n=1 Tax=uncultured Amnibacterium sp. TaxID=1631851 RepID=UPI0035CB6567
MAVQRMHHVGVVVEDLEATRDFFVAIGLELEGEWVAEGDWVGRVIGLEGVRSRCAMLRTRDGGSRLELSEFESPAGQTGSPAAPSHAPGLRHLAFPVDDLAATLEIVRELGYDTIGSVERSDPYVLCYVRGPEGLLVELAEETADQR